VPAYKVHTEHPAKPEEEGTPKTAFLIGRERDMRLVFIFALLLRALQRSLARITSA
jgi:hypothetical protein